MIFDSLNTLAKFKKNQYLSPVELKQYQDTRLRNLVRHAYEKVKYYRNLFDSANLSPEDVGGIDDLYKIPITSKQDIKKIPQEDLVDASVDLSQCIKKYTSGSTGNPMKIYLSPRERDFQILLNLRILRENGLRLGDKFAYIINPHRIPKSKYWFQHLGILRRDYASVFSGPKEHVEFLRNYKPDIIYGYPSNLTVLADYMRKHHINGIRPKTVFSVAELLEPTARELINMVFDVKTCDILGTIEIGDIAWQCEKRQGYHINSDAIVAEFLNDHGFAQPGEEGRMVCTSLYSYTMPFIRYAVNDLCIPSDRLCSCGRTLPLIDSINGRANDFVVLPDGQVIASCFLVIIMQDFHEVSQYRMVQESKESLKVQIVEGIGFESGTANRIKLEIEKATEGALDVEIHCVGALERDTSGKIRTIVSKVIPDFLDTIV